MVGAKIRQGRKRFFICGAHSDSSVICFGRTDVAMVLQPFFRFAKCLVDFLPCKQCVNSVGLPSIPRSLTANPSTALLSYYLAANWQGIGLYAVIYSAGLRTISPSIYDSMKVDGLSDLQKIRRVICPMMKDTIALALVLVICCFLQDFRVGLRIDRRRSRAPH